MSDAEMRSGRGRLPGMGAPATAAPPPAPPKAEGAAPQVVEDAAPAPAAESGAARAVKPGPAGARRARGSEGRGREDPARTAALAATPAAFPPHAPYAGEPKVQVNPRLFRGIWRHYEELVDELPRERRRGALTALVNAVLAQHAPGDVAEARAAIAWLRLAESRDAPADAAPQR